MKRKLKAITATLLSLAMVLTVLPRIARAETDPAAGATAGTETVSSGEPYAVTELTGQRRENVKYFLMSDRTVTAAVYEQPVHYWNGSDWADIDNSIASATDAETGSEVFETQGNSFETKFSKKAGQNRLVTLKQDGRTVSWTLAGARKVKAAAVESSDEAPAGVDRKLHLKNLTGAVVYEDVLPQVDLRYTAAAASVKEDIILKSADAPRSFTFEYTLKKLSYREETDGSVVFIDPAAPETVLFTVEKPYMYDAAGEYSDAVELRVSETKKGISIEVVADSTWLADPERVWPVTIDPTTYPKYTAKNIKDTTASFTTKANSKYTELQKESDSLKVGRRGSAELATLVYADLVSVLPPNSAVVNATLGLSCYRYSFSSSPTDLQLNLYMITSDWDQTNISSDIPLCTDTSPATPSAESIVLDYAMFNDASTSKHGAWTSFNFTQAMQRWMNGEQNRGLMIRATGLPSSEKFARFFSSDASGDVTDPSFIITYRNTVGLEDYWSYSTMDAGSSGSSAVNLYNGNLVYTHVDLIHDTNINGFTLSHVYNSSLAGDGEGRYGAGWRLNLVQKLEPVTSTDLTQTNAKYVYTDGDGTRHYFIQTDSGIKDEDGLGYTYSDISEGELTRKLTNDDGTVLKFDQWNYLRKIIDPNGNTVSMNYRPLSTDNYLANITTSTGSTYWLRYDSDYKLTQIEDNLGRVTRFERSGGDLVHIIYPDGSSTNFAYSSHRMITMHYPYEQRFYFSYDSRGRVIRTSHSGSDNTIAETAAYSYGYNNTVVTDGDNRSLTYQFDIFGRVTGIFDSNQNVYSQTYTGVSTSGSTIFQNNKVKTVSNGAVYVNNYVANPGFTYEWTDWVQYKPTGATCELTTDSHLLTARSVRIINPQDLTTCVYQWKPSNVPSSGTLTLSAYIKMVNVTSQTDGGAGLEIVTSTDRRVFSEWETGTTDTSIDGGFRKFSVSITLNAGETINRFSVGLFHATGTIYVDSVQFEAGATANKLNLVDNSSFERFDSSNHDLPYRFFSNYTPIAGDYAAWGQGLLYGREGSYSCRIMGVATQDRYIRQDFAIFGGTGDTYSFGGWAKANAVPSRTTDNPLLKIVCEFVYSDGTSEQTFLSFNDFVTGWQFQTKTAVAKRAYYKMVLYFVYSRNCNESFFDSLFLYRDTQQSYVYDDNGNVISVSDSESSSSFEYKNNLLSKLVNPSGSTFTYDYDSKKNLTEAKSETLKYSFTYDQYGNPTTSETAPLNEDSEAGKITSSATYSGNGNYLGSVTDSRGNITRYTYDTARHLQTGVTDANGNTTSYTYHDKNDYLLGVTSDGKTVGYGYNVSRALSSITSANGTKYSFTYDKFGRQTGIKVGSRSLSTTTYKNDRSSLDSRFDYGNGAYRTYTYDSLDRLTAESVNGTQALSYLYDKNNFIAQTTDYLSGITTKFYYDLIGRITEVTASNGMQLGYSYDSGKNRLKGYTAELSAIKSLAYTYRYGAKDTDEPITDAVYGVLLNGTEQIGYKYDDLGRLQSRTLVNGYVTEYDYLEGWAAGTTTTLVKTVKNGEDTLEYTYDNLGNIQSISKNGELQESYTYDALGQLTSVTDADGNVTGYTYDDGGNILSVTKNGTVIKSYTYGDSEWKDLLTGFNGQAITYDEIGNPLQYRDGLAFSWQNGRQLAEISQNGKVLASYNYDVNGLRTSKTVNGKTTDYYWLNGVLQAQKTGNEYLIFLYDENGSAYGFLVKNGASEAYYYYVYNAQGDVIGLLDSAGERVVEYTYGAWGEITSVTGTLASTIGKQNPLRYRGYYYDEETGFYYLQSRYYDPVTQRFLNADDAASLGADGELLSYNLYSYCLNNPIKYNDPSGESATATGFLAGGLAAGGANAWNPVGLAILGIVAVVAIVVTIYYAVTAYNNSKLASAKAMMSYASTAATPPPPNRGGKGTQTTSKTLYNKSGKNGFRIDVENPGNRIGQIHMQKDGIKYFYNVQQQAFCIGSSDGELASKAIQELLKDPNVIKAISKGLTILGY